MHGQISKTKYSTVIAHLRIIVNNSIIVTRLLSDYFSGHCV